MTPELVHPNAVRRKVETWLAQQDDTDNDSDSKDRRTAIALRALPVWTSEPVLTVGAVSVRIVPCSTPLAARAALHDRRDDERLVLLTDLSDSELGDGLLAYLSGSQVRSVDRWDLVRQMFGLTELDPAIIRSALGGGKWVADALTRYTPAQGWPPPQGAFLTRDYALRCLTVRLLDMDVDREQLDSAGLVEWSTDAHRVLAFSSLPHEILDPITAFLTEVAGPVAVSIVSAVRAGHGIEVIPLGLLVSALWPRDTAVPRDAAVSTDIAVAQTRLEPYFGGVRLTGSQADALRTLTEAWVDRALDDADLAHDAHRMIKRAEELAATIDATDLLIASDLLPSGFVQRLRAFAATVRSALTTARPSTANVIAAQRALEILDQHRSLDDRPRVEAAWMAVRLLRWLAAPDQAAPRTLYDALLRQIRQDGWVDRARLDIFTGDTDPQIAETYKQLCRAVDTRRARHDREFAELLAADTAADSEPGAMLRVEDVLERVVHPFLRHKPMLLLVLDGMSVAAATELAESLTRSGSWMELTPGGEARTGVLAALPTITDVSRCSLLSGRIAVGTAHEERIAFTGHFPNAQLLHKGSLRADAGSALDADIVAALDNSSIPLVAAVVNTIDDALNRSHPDTIVWGVDNITVVRDLLAHAHNRIVVILSDHGHVIDRGPDAVTRTSPSTEDRWRPANPPAGDGEIAMRGTRVAVNGGAVVLPWREEIRYGPRNAGYHGGASPAEAVIPLIVLTSGDEQAVPGWSGAPVASPAWWRETRPDTDKARVPVHFGKSTEATLFDTLPAEPPAAEVPTSSTRPAAVDALLTSEIYRRRRGTRAALPDDRVAALLEVLIAAGGRATLDTLAARAHVPAHRISGTVTALRKLLQVEGYPVVELDADGKTVKLDEALLAEQFDLELP